MRIPMGKYSVELTEKTVRDVQKKLLEGKLDTYIYECAIIPHTIKDYLDAFCSYMVRET